LAELSKVLINAASVKAGGPLVLLRRAVPALIEAADGRFSVTTIVDPAIAPLLESDAFGEIVAVDNPIGSAIRSGWFYEVVLPRLVTKYCASVLFSMTNYLPSRRLRCNTMLLVQHAGYFDIRFEHQHKRVFPSARDRLSWALKKRRVHQSVRCADLVTVQNEDLASRISLETARPLSDIHVCHHGPGTVSHRGAPQDIDYAGVATVRIGCFSTAGVQKNLGVLFGAARILVNSGVSIKLVTTLGRDSVFRREALHEIDRLGLRGYIEDHAEVSPEKMYALYDSINMFVWPSLCESFGFPLVEAMARGVACIAADTASHRHIVAGCCPLFVPDDSKQLAAILAGVIGDPAEFRKLGSTCHSRGSSFSWAAVGRSWCEALRQLQDGGRFHVR